MRHSLKGRVSGYSPKIIVGSSPAWRTKKYNRKAVSTIAAAKKLTPKQKAFVSEYLIDLNATQAAIRAGYSPKTANEQGARLLANVSIAKAIQKATNKRQERTEITQDRVLKEYARIAFLDPRRFFDSDGTPKPIEALDDDTAAALAGLEIHEEFSGVGEDRELAGYTKKYKLANKLGALDSLAKHLGMFDGKGQETESDTQTGVILMPEVAEDE